MSTPPLPKVAGISPALTGVPQNSRSAGDAPDDPTRGGRTDNPRGDVRDRLASWTSGLSTLHDLTDRLGRTTTLGEALHETLRAGAGLLGARRGLLALRPADGLGPERLIGLGLSHAELGHIETLPPRSAPHTRLLDAPPEPAAPAEILHPDIAHDDGIDPRHREVSAHLGCAASYAVPLAGVGAALWLYDRPATPDPRQRQLLARYLRQAAPHLADRIELSRARTTLRAMREALLPRRLPLFPGTALAVRHRGTPFGSGTLSAGGGDFYDALALPEGALGMAIGATNGTGPAALAAAGTLRAGLRAYAVMEGEDPVAVLSDLELLLRLTEPDRCATALFCYAEPPLSPTAARRLVIASAGHPPPLFIGATRVAFAETTLSAPLGMLTCWEAPSVQLDIAKGETVLLYNTGLLRATGEPRDGAFARLESAARAAAPEVRADPEALADHVLHAVLAGAAQPAEDVILLAARF